MRDKREAGLSPPSDSQAIVHVLRNEQIEEDGIAEALCAVCDFSLFADANYSDDDFRQARRGFEEQDAWIYIADRFYSTNPLSNRIYKLFSDFYLKKSSGDIGFLSIEYSLGEKFRGVTNESAELNEENVSTSLDVLIDSIIRRGLDKGANDIHISQNVFGDTDLALRVDGSLRPEKTYKNVDYTSLCNLLWNRCNDASRKARDPQDGQFEVVYEGQPVQFRVNRFIETLSTGKSDKWALRILQGDRNLRTLDQFGLEPDDIEEFRHQFGQKSGLIIFTGPTSQGKSSMVHAGIRMAMEINPDHHWLSAEKPVERFLESVHQATADDDAQTFEILLESFLRQDPDCIFVGELNNNEVATMSMQAAATGHLMVTTMHVTTAHGAFERLVDLGQDKSQVADKMLLFSAQRLLKKLCPHCKIETSLDTYTSYVRTLYEQLLVDISGGSLRVFKHNPDGCGECNSGYKGRQLVLELLQNSAALEEWVIAGGSMSLYRRQSIENGSFIDLNYRAMEQVYRGNIDIEQMNCMPSIRKDRPGLEAKFAKRRGMHHG